MDAIDEHDDQDDDDVAIHRARAREMLVQIARQTKQALVEAAIDIDVFFLLPSSGNSILIFGTPGDPSDREWHRVAEIVEPIVRQSVGLDRTRRREVVCAATHDQESHDAIA